MSLTVVDMRDENLNTPAEVNPQIDRNRERLDEEDFMFQITNQEFADLKSQL